MTASAIRPCPFCGDPDPAIDEIDIGIFALICNGCGCTGPIENFANARQSAARAIELWNERPT